MESETLPDEYFSLVPENGSLGYLSEYSTNKEEKESLEMLIQQEEFSDKINRCLQGESSNCKKIESNVSLSTYESLTNEMYFGHLSFEKKYFELGTGEEKNEISSAADIADFVANIEPTSFYDVNYLKDSDKLDESKKFREMLSGSKEYSNVGKSILDLQHCTTMVDNSNLRQPAPFKLDKVLLSGNGKDFNSQDFRLVTEEEYMKTKTEGEESPQSPGEEVEKGEMVTSDNDYSITNLEHPSYLKSFSTFQKLPSFLQEISISDHLPLENSDEVCEDLKLERPKTVFTKQCSSKAVVIGCKIKLEDKSAERTDLENGLVGNGSDGHGQSTKHVKVKRIHSENDGLRKRLARKHINNKRGKSLSDSSYSHHSTDRSSKESFKSLSNREYRGRIHNLYNFDVSSMIETSNYVRSNVSSMISEPPDIFRWRKQQISPGVTSPEPSKLVNNFEMYPASLSETSASVGNEQSIILTEEHSDEDSKATSKPSEEIPSECNTVDQISDTMDDFTNVNISLSGEALQHLSFHGETSRGEDNGSAANVAINSNNQPTIGKAFPKQETSLSGEMVPDNSNEWVQSASCADRLFYLTNKMESINLRDGIVSENKKGNMYQGLSDSDSSLSSSDEETLEVFHQNCKRTSSADDSHISGLVGVSVPNSPSLCSTAAPFQALHSDMVVTDQPAVMETETYGHVIDSKEEDLTRPGSRFFFPDNIQSISHERSRGEANSSFSSKSSLSNEVPINFNGVSPVLFQNFCYDAGYASERSPDEESECAFDIETLSSDKEHTPLQMETAPLQQMEECGIEEAPLLRLLVEGENLTTATVMETFPFVNECSMFDVIVEKNSRGLGLSLCGGCETRGYYSGLLTIKKLYPQMPAWLCGQLKQGDIVLEANGECLSGLSSHEALEVLRTTKSSGVHLLVCRPPTDVVNDVTALSPPPSQSHHHSFNDSVVATSLLGVPASSSSRHLSPSPVPSMCGEFEVALTKVKGSLGFTLRKQDNSILGHTIRTLVREPALSDGRLRPGDKILSVNGMDLCGLSHEEAIAFLRTTPQTVTIRLFRDVLQTPISPISPSDPETSILKPKALRQEARDMLTDLAFRKKSSPSFSPRNDHHSPSPGSNRRRRLHKTPTPDGSKNTTILDRFDSLVRKAEGEYDPNLTPVPLHFGQHSICSNESYESFASRGSTLVSRNTSVASNDTNSLSECSTDSRKLRPTFLDLECRKSCSRKTEFTPPHEREHSFPSPFLCEEEEYSMHSVDSAPPLASAQSVSPSFAHNQITYQSVNFDHLHNQKETTLTTTSSDYNIRSYANENKQQKSGLLKWKGTTMPPEEETQSECFETENRTDEGSNPLKSHRMKEVTINLHRGWNSRLGFSLKTDGEVTRVVAIYSGCVAAKDGRLKIGDIVLMVNDEDVRDWDTPKVIDLLRKTHGKINLRVLQQPF